MKIFAGSRNLAQTTEDPREGGRGQHSYASTTCF